MDDRAPSLFGIARRARATQPVFITGEARSGTSLLYRLLQQHPAFSPGSLNLVESDAVIRLATLPRIDLPAADSLYTFLLGDDEAWNGFRRSVRALSLVRPFTAAIGRRLGSRAPRLWWLTGGALTLRSFFFFAEQVRGSRRLVEKTPQNTPYASHLRLAFPRAKLIFVCRHPVDVFGSYRRRSTIDTDAAWTRVSVDEFVNRYRYMTDEALRFTRRHPSMLSIIRYEDLTTDVETTFDEVCRFVDEAPNRKALFRDTSNEGAVPFDPHLFGSVVERTKSWSDYVTLEEADVIEAQLAPVMTKLGYEPHRRAEGDPEIALR